jgi:hypothetical protein
MGYRKPQPKRAYTVLKKMGVPVFRKEGSALFYISAEENNSDEWINYYNEFPEIWAGGDINPQLQITLDSHGLHAEWVDPGHMGVYEGGY